MLLIYFGLCKFAKFLMSFLSARVKIHQIRVIYEAINQFFFKFFITFQSHETYLFCTFLAEILYTFNKMSPSKYKFAQILGEQSKVWNFALWWAPLSKSCTFSAKREQKSYLSWHWRVMQSLKKNCFVISNLT